MAVGIGVVKKACQHDSWYLYWGSPTEKCGVQQCWWTPVANVADWRAKYGVVIHRPLRRRNSVSNRTLMRDGGRNRAVTRFDGATRPEQKESAVGEKTLHAGKKRGRQEPKTHF